MSDQSDDEKWQDEDDDDGYIPCPYCGATMLEAADYCPGCDRWITGDDLPAKRQSPWIIAVVMILIVVMVLAAVRF